MHQPERGRESERKRKRKRQREQEGERERTREREKERDSEIEKKFAWVLITPVLCTICMGFKAYPLEPIRITTYNFVEILKPMLFASTYTLVDQTNEKYR